MQPLSPQRAAAEAVPAALGAPGDQRRPRFHRQMLKKVETAAAVVVAPSELAAAAVLEAPRVREPMAARVALQMEAVVAAEAAETVQPARVPTEPLAAVAEQVALLPMVAVPEV